MDGVSGSGSSGGGSGGSIFIECTSLDGHGLISSNGGDGLQDGGSGAGGRISVNLLQRLVTYQGRKHDIHETIYNLPIYKHLFIQSVKCIRN